MPDRLVVDLGGDGRAKVMWMPPGGGLAEEVSEGPLTWPLDDDALEDLRWYLEDYLLAPFGVWEERGPAVRAKLAGWGDQVFGSVFIDGPARFAYERARDRGLEVVFRSADPGRLAFPWELMRDGAGPVALGAGGISRSLPVAGAAGTLEVPGGKLRVLMVISRPGGTNDIGYQMVARPLLERLDAVRGEVELTVLRPPTFDALARTVKQAAEAGTPFHVVHFDGHGAMLDGLDTGNGTGSGGGGGMPWTRPSMMIGSPEGVLAFEKPEGGSDLIGSSKVASALAAGQVPVVVLNACQSGAVGKELEASVATALLNAGCAAVVAMAYSVYAVAAAEFMAAFYEALFAGKSVGQAVTAGRKRLFEHDGRPSPKGDMRLADWLVPVHYLRRDVVFPQARINRPAQAPSLDEALNEIRSAPGEAAEAQDPLAAVNGVFVGRDDLFYQLEAAARAQRVVVLVGPGGTGKTELAKGFARWWRDTGGTDDPRLVFWHSFEPGVATFGLDGVITSLGLSVFGTDFARLDPPDRLSAVKKLLGQYKCLLLWDNFESVAEMPDPAGATPALAETGQAQLRDFLQWVRAHSKSTVIITSRAREDWLGDLRRIPVGGLNRAEAVEYAGLLLADLPTAQHRREQRAFGELLTWLYGHPLAMRLTLPRLEETDAATLLADLQGTAAMPVGDETGQGRLSSLAACISYSFAHLSDLTRRLLPAVSLFHAVADADVLAVFSAVDGVPTRFARTGKEEWTAVLEDAARVGLLSGIGSGMYRIHPALPGYLAAAWRGSAPGGYHAEREDAEQALSAACAVLSRWLTREIESGDAAFAYSIIGLQRQTLGAMLGYALDHRSWDNADSLVRALDEYRVTRGHTEDATAWTDRVLDATAEPNGGPANGAESLWLYTLGRHASWQMEAGQPGKAIEAYRQILAWQKDQSETRLQRSNIAVTYHQLGTAAQALGRLDEAEEWYHKSLTIKEELGNRPGMASTYHQLGIGAQHQGRLDEAEEWYRKSLTIKEELGNRPDIAASYHQLGNVAYLRGRLDEADEWYRKSLSIEQELGGRSGVASTYHQLGMTAQDRGRFDEADDWYRKSLTIKEELGNRPGMASTYHELGIIAQNRGRLDDADDWYRRSVAISEELGNLLELSMSYGQLGLLAEDRQQPRQALKWIIRCVTLFSEFPSPQTGPGASHLARLSSQLGIPVLEEEWREVTGQTVPQAVLDYVASHSEG